ncbi:hypothetical protein AABB24_012779 [Solanum stoloniferum]|uniref:Peptidase C1A papain C-terminal domain-containing protein n=1 Tax=Solanum stoloniferum TaxID=62892 RepID=A0ABD2U4H5_9SOLN
MEQAYTEIEDYGESVGKKIVGCHWGCSVMTPIRKQHLSLSCAPQVVCDAISSKLAILSKRFMKVSLERPNRSLRGQTSCSNRAVVPILFSVQELYDCVDREEVSMKLRDAFQYVMLKGINIEQRYPQAYQNCQEDCQCAKISARKITVTGWKKLNGLQEILGALEVQPVIGTTKFGSIRTFMCSHPDVIVRLKDAEDTPESSSSGTRSHAILVIGHGYDTDNNLYYVVKNSWGLRWGSHGYMKFEAALLNHFYIPERVLWKSPEDVRLQYEARDG